MAAFQDSPAPVRSGPAERPREVPRELPPAILSDPNPGLLAALLHGLYDLVWLAAILLASPWWLARLAWDRGFRRMVGERLARGVPRLPPSATQRVLVHGVSVGEVKGAVPLVRALEDAHPELEIVVSTCTDTGLEVARKLFPGRTVVRFPFDLSPIMTRFLRRLRPSSVVLVELEIWPNFLRQCNRAGTPVVVVNGRITPASFRRYRVFRRTLPQFNRISLFCVQSEEYAQRFGFLCRSRERVLITGNMKADGLHRGPAPEPRELARLLGGAPGQLVLVAGSTHHPEERLVTQAWLEAVPQARLVLVPRHPPRAAAVLEELASLGRPGQLLSRLRAGEAPDPSRPAVVDTIGELESVYALADLVFVGGTLLPHGGQNMLEPAALGRPVVHGPSVENFVQEAHLLLQAGGSRRIEPGELARAFAELCGDRARRERMGEAGRAAVEAQKGATALTLEVLSRSCLGASGRAHGARLAPR